jgi:1-acyl-sn-glycerol-3-phosphate acyltransferase
MISKIKTDHPIISLTYYILRKFIGIPVRWFLIKEVSGINNIPKNESVILAFNHQSFFDFICFAAISPRNVHFLSAEKFFSHPLWKILMTLTGQIRVNREDHDKNEVHESVERHVKKGALIGIFPEGTRSPHEYEMLKMFNGVAKYALQHRIKIIPVGIRGTYNVMSKHDNFPNISKSVSIHIGEPLDFGEHHHKHSDKIICTYVTETVVKSIEKLSLKRYPHYEYL